MRLAGVTDDVSFQIVEERHHVAGQPGETQEVHTHPLRLVRQLPGGLKGLGSQNMVLRNGSAGTWQVAQPMVVNSCSPRAASASIPSGGWVLWGIGRVACRKAMAVTSPT